MWFLCIQIDKCGDNWKLIYYGENIFIYIEIILGLRKKDDIYILDRSGGEEEKDKKLIVCKGCQFMGFFIFLSFSVILFLVQ